MRQTTAMTSLSAAEATMAEAMFRYGYHAGADQSDSIVDDLPQCARALQPCRLRIRHVRTRHLPGIVACSPGCTTGLRL